MKSLSPLEMAVGTALAHQVAARADDLLAQLQSAQVTKREFTGVGFFTRFTVDRRLLPVLVRRSPDGCVEARVGPEAYPLQFMIYVRDGYAQTIEAYSYGEGYGDLDLLNATFTEPAPVTLVRVNEHDNTSRH